jgi:hypothetical protein
MVRKSELKISIISLNVENISKKIAVYTFITYEKDLQKVSIKSVH